MQLSTESSPADPEPVMLPRYAINMARRVVQLLALGDSLTLCIIRVDGNCYLVIPGGKPERL